MPLVLSLEPSPSLRIQLPSSKDMLNKVRGLLDLPALQSRERVIVEFYVTVSHPPDSYDARAL